MKMQKSGNLKRKWPTLVVFYVVLVALFCLSVFGVWAYFTAKSQRQTDLKFASLDINLLQDGKVVSASSLSLSQKLLPGDSLNLPNVTVSNVQNADVYVLAKVTIKITPVVEGAEEVVLDLWCNLSGDAVDATNVSTAATLIEVGEEEPLVFKTPIGSDLGDEYKQAIVNIKLTVYGIQTLLDTSTQYPTPEVYASYLIITQVANA